ncbi:MAG: hypothetical protein AAF609_11230 [Cyanobacteria bacterium P01_C01_bin.120]
MLRQDLTSNNGSNNTAAQVAAASEPAVTHSETVKRLDIQQSLNVLEELILESPRIPFSGRTLIDEDQLLEQLDRIRLNLPTVFQEAMQIVQQREHIIADAHQYAQDVIDTAEQEAAQRLDDLGIVQQAESQARQVKQQLEQDCEALRSQTRSEIDQWQTAAQQYWNETRQQTEDDCVALRQDADTYAAEMLQRLEHQLSEMMRVVRNGQAALPVDASAVETTARQQETSPKTKSATLPASESSRQGRTRRSSPA